jgi:hypothetical protein
MKRSLRGLPVRPLLGLALMLLLGLVLAAPAVAQPAKNTGTYKISNVTDVRTRSAIAATGADVFEVGHDYVLVEATGREARALKRLGLELVVQNAGGNDPRPPLWFEGRDGRRVKASRQVPEPLPASSSSPSRTPSSSRSMPARAPEPGGAQV